MNHESKTTMMPQLRVEKSGNKNKDDLRVMIAGVILCVMMIFGQTAYQKVYDEFFAPRPFITATVELVHVDPDLPPLIKYDADPNQHVEGVWVASVYTSDGTRLTSRRGMGHYNLAEDDPKFWAWTAWFDNEQSDPPLVPNEPFYVCVRYQVHTTDSGVDDSTGPFCSNVYDPDNPLNVISEYLEEEVVR
ncbi:hypothetical protein [Roseovarius Plymouth podovirus 1]|uniref:Uncharacterized protein n=1 Tax=Roseovarius Plymouth podovirus 1 TaxID=926474 RepID=K4Q530_9CAUD|nr:hypothetical protein HYO70_gp75 [Roseovarius Plymouth podovirus 1]CBX88005.1 hypothetical protein [Roseovarius Plymouth podovirus 1]